MGFSLKKIARKCKGENRFTRAARSMKRKICIDYFLFAKLSEKKKKNNEKLKIAKKITLKFRAKCKKSPELKSVKIISNY